MNAPLILALVALALLALDALLSLRGTRQRIQRRLQGIADMGVDQEAIDRRLRAL